MRMNWLKQSVFADVSTSDYWGRVYMISVELALFCCRQSYMCFFRAYRMQIEHFHKDENAKKSVNLSMKIIFWKINCICFSQDLKGGIWTACGQNSIVHKSNHANLFSSLIVFCSSFFNSIFMYV